MANDTDEHSKITTLEEYHQRLPRRWPVILAGIVIALALAIAAVFIVRAIYRHHHHQPAKAPTSGTSKVTKSHSQVVSRGSNSNDKSSSGDNLPDSGPGQMAGLFVGSTAAAAGLHYFINYRRRRAG